MTSKGNECGKGNFKTKQKFAPEIAAFFADLATRVDTIDIVDERDVLNLVANDVKVTVKC